MTKDEALNIAIDYMNERLEEHDAKFQRHPVAEAERNNILADIEAVKEALAQPEQDWSMIEAMQGSLREHMARIKELESQLARPEQEPFAFLHPQKGFYFAKPTKITAPTIVDVEPLPLYTTPPQRKPLTDEQKDRLANAWFSKDGDTDVSHRKAIALIEEVEAAHGIKGVA